MGSQMQLRSRVLVSEHLPALLRNELRLQPSCTLRALARPPTLGRASLDELALRVVAANVGPPGRMGYAIVGDAINIASELTQVWR